MGSDPNNAAVRSTLGSYRLFEELGRDPLGVLHLACPAGARTFPKWAIVRRMHAGVARDPVLVHAFLAATQAAVRMVHPNIASTFDFGGKMSLPWAAREHLFGAPVPDLIAYLSGQGTKVPWQVACHLVAEAAVGVAAVRARLPAYGPPMGFLMGAVTPHIFVTQWGDVKIVDGCLPLFDGVPLVDSQSLPYRPREPEGVVPAAGRSDAFGLGVLLWELIAGRRLFAGQNDDETYRLIDANVVPTLKQLSRVPSMIDDIVLRTVGKHAAHAPALDTAAELGEEIRAAMVAEGKRGVADDLAQLMTETFGKVMGAQRTALSVAWAREQALQEQGDVLPDLTSDADVTRVSGDTVRDTTTETAIVRRAGSRVEEGFDDVPTSVRRTSSSDVPSWRPHTPSATPMLVVPPRIDYLPDFDQTGDAISLGSLTVNAPEDDQQEEPTYIEPPSFDPVAGVGQVAAPIARSAWTPLTLPPLERNPVPLSTRAPMQPARAPAPTVPSTLRVEERPSLLMVGVVCLTLALVAVIALGVRRRFAESDDTPSRAVDSPLTTATAAPSASAAPMARAHRPVDPWTALPVTGTPVATPDDLPRAVSPPSGGYVAPRPGPLGARVTPAAHGGHTGLLTVICTPACDRVFDGSRLLGPSPVFKLPVSAGVHRLRLRIDTAAVEKVVTVNVAENDSLVVRENIGD